jgi:hypothetical protein
MPVYLGRDEFPDELLGMSDQEVGRLFLACALATPLQAESARQRIAAWRADLKRLRREANTAAKAKAEGA